jgi:tetratricopeptide (TPR) repeat protein
MQICPVRLLLASLSAQAALLVSSAAMAQTPDRPPAPAGRGQTLERPAVSRVRPSAGVASASRPKFPGTAAASGPTAERAKEFNRQGIALQSEGKLTEACALYRQAIGLNPAGAGYHNNLALVLKDLDQIKEAEAEERIALKQRPKRADYHVNLGIILQRQKRFAEAEASFKEALSIDAGDSDCNYRLGQTYLELGEYDKAVDAAKLALMLKPDNAQYNELMGDIYMKSGKMDDAMIQYRRVIEINGFTPATIAGDLKSKIDFIKSASPRK